MLNSKSYHLPSVVIATGITISFTGFFLGKAIISIGMIIMLLSIFINKGYTNLLYLKKDNNYYYGLIAYFLLLAISGLWSNNWEEYIIALQLKLPLLLLPLVFISSGKIDNRIFHLILKGLFITITFVNLYLFFTNFIDISKLNAMYQQGRVIKTPMMHIRYSLLCGYNVFIGVYLIQKNNFKSLYKILIGLGTLFAFIFVNILAVRTGMVALYAGIFAVIIGYIINSKKYILGLSMAFIIILGLFTSIKYIPTLKNKWNYTIYSIKEMQAGNDIARLSDSYRLGSISAGIHIGNNSPIIGVGIGDVKPLTQEYVKQRYPSIAHEIYTPQSQYVMSYSTLGIIGFIIFLIITMIPLLAGWKTFDINTIGFHGMLIASFIVEQTLETQLGTSIYLIFGLLSYSILENKRLT